MGCPGVGEVCRFSCPWRRHEGSMVATEELVAYFGRYLGWMPFSRAQRKTLIGEPLND
jgi:hypothetical protein